MDRRITTLLVPLLLALVGCRDFNLPPKAESRDVTADPAEAFGDQEIALRFTGTVDIATVQVSIAGKLAVLADGQDGNGLVRAVVPRLPGTCQSAISVVVSAPGATFNATTLGYKGVGHPGDPRPVLTTNTKSVSFMPSNLALLGEVDTRSWLIASGWGEAAMIFAAAGGALQQLTTLYRDDFVLALDSPGGAAVVDVTSHGTVESFQAMELPTPDAGPEPKYSDAGSNGMFADAGSGTSPITVTDLATQLPSALSQAPSLAVLSGGSGQSGKGAGRGGGASFSGLLLAATPSLSAFALDCSGDGLTVNEALDVTATLRSGGNALVTALDGDELTLFRGGSNPGVWLLDSMGDRLQDHLFNLDADDWNLTAATGAQKGVSAAFLQASAGLEGRLVVVGKQGDVPCDPTSCDGPCTQSGAQGVCSTLSGYCQCDTMVITIGDAGLPSEDLLAVAVLPVRGAPMISLAAASSDADSLVYGVNGADQFLYPFRLAQGALSALAPIALPEPGSRVLVTPASVSSSDPAAGIIVVGKSGTLYPGPRFDANRVRVGVTSVAPLLGPSCGTPQAVVSGGELGATVVVPTAEGQSAFLEGAHAADFADTVSFERDGGVPLTYFYSGGRGTAFDGGVYPGFVVSQTTAQIYDLLADGGLPKKTEFFFSARAATSVKATDEISTLVVGGPEGLRFISMSAYALPARDSATLHPSCLDVHRLAPLGDGRVFALATRTEADDGSVDQTLCLADPSSSTNEIVVGVVHFPVAAIAAADTLESQKPAHHLYTAGWEAPPGQPQSLVVRHADPSDADALGKLAALDFSGRARQLLPTGGALISAMAVSPDGRRLLVALAGEHPGLVSIDPWPFLHAGSDAERAGAITTLTLPAAPVGIGFTQDGAMAVVALQDDSLAFIQ